MVTMGVTPGVTPGGKLLRGWGDQSLENQIYGENLSIKKLRFPGLNAVNHRGHHGGHSGVPMGVTPVVIPGVTAGVTA